VDLKLPTSNEEILLLHNPKCSKSRATLGLLEERGVAFQTRLYLENPLGQEELADLGQRLGKPALEFTRSKQAEFAHASLDASSPEAEIFAAMAAEPILMERPILIRGKRAAIGRPPEDVLLLLDD
jgi:arsenate reductase